MSAKTPYYLCLIFCGVVLLQACATVQLTSGKVRTYSMDFDTVVAKVDSCFNRTGLVALKTWQSNNPSRKTYLIAKGASPSSVGNSVVGSEHVEHKKGKVEVKQLPDARVQVQVENPDYHFTVPEYKRQDYRRSFFQVLDRMMEESGKTSKG